jgi:formamidopyrimidine-DNA glycosylase
VVVRYRAPVPEILEVERYRVFAERALGRTIAKVWMVDARYGRGGTTPQRLRAALAGRAFTQARRRGKLMLLDTAGGPTLGLRFGMTGGIVVDGREALDRLRYGPGVFNEKWVRARLTFEDGGALLIHDPRRFGSLELAPDEERLGPDALSVTRRELATALAVGASRNNATAAPLKARLMDQERLAGIGNLLADEILWRAGLAPGRRTPLSDDELRVLHTSLRSTLRQLSRRGGSHLGDLMEERHPEGRCPLDGTELRREEVGGRTTYWCPVHQH